MKTLLSAIFATNKPKRKVSFDEVHILHLRNYENPLANTRLSHGGVTIAMQVAPNATVRAAVAVCSGRDNFNRKKGRELAMARFEDHTVGFYYEFYMPPHILELDQFSALEEIAFHVMDICPFTDKARMIMIEELESRSFLGV